MKILYYDGEVWSERKGTTLTWGDEDGFQMSFTLSIDSKIEWVSEKDASEIKKREKSPIGLCCHPLVSFIRVDGVIAPAFLKNEFSTCILEAQRNAGAYKPPKKQRAYTVSAYGEVETSPDWEVTDLFSPLELVWSAYRVLMLQEEVFGDIAKKLLRRWHSASDDAHDLIRAHIANILALQRGVSIIEGGDNRIDYCLLALCGGTEGERYRDKLILRWENGKKRGYVY